MSQAAVKQKDRMPNYALSCTVCSSNTERGFNVELGIRFPNLTIKEALLRPFRKEVKLYKIKNYFLKKLLKDRYHTSLKKHS